ncbi:MAG: carboxypeptidase regulatory-like domain-containing protein [Acidobacteria bacterium]|nr:carboxypeptidase regulatory-like domain-containing protein [Acidobacteriota bacterium]
MDGKNLLLILGIILLVALTLLVLFGDKSGTGSPAVRTAEQQSSTRLTPRRERSALPEAPNQEMAVVGLVFERQDYTDPDRGGISGHVTDALGNTIPFQVVEILPVEMMSYPTQFFTTTKVLTDHNGFFIFRDLPPRQYTLFCGELREILPVAPGEMLVRDVVLPGSGLVSGEVRDADGQIIFPASVYVLSRRSRFISQTNESGRFELRGMPPGSYHLSARADGYTASTISEITLADMEEKTGLLLTLDPGATIVGTVRDEARQPVAGIRISTPRDPERLGTQMGLSDEQGYFMIEGVPPGRTRLEIWTEGSQPRPGPEVDVSLHQENLVEIILTEGRQILGFVCMDKGLAIPDDLQALARHMESRRSRTSPFNVAVDPEGQFRFVMLEPGEYQVQLLTQSEDFILPEPVNVDLTKDDTAEVLFDLRRGAVLTGTISAGRAMDFSQSSVRLDVTTPDQDRYSRSIRSDSSGRFTFSGLEAGIGRLNVFLEGYIPQDREGIILDTGSTTHVDIQLSTGSGVWGYVIDTDGRPLPGLTVFARPYGDASFRNLPKSVTTGDGRYRLDGLPGGDYLLYVLYKDPRNRNQLRNIRREISIDGRRAEYRLDFQITLSDLSR